MTIVNSTITGNHSGNYGGGIDSWSGSLTLINSIVAANTASGSGTDIYQSGATPTKALHSLSSFTNWTNGATPANGNVVYDGTKPLFVNGADGDYRLTADSQARNLGTAVEGATPASRDLAGNPRMTKTGDLGAYEVQLTADKSVKTAAKVKATKASVTTQSFEVTWAEAADADGYWVEWYVKKTLVGSMWVANAPGATQSATITGLQPGVAYSVRIYTTTAADKKSAKFAKATVKTLAVPAATKVKAKAVSVNAIEVAWKAPAAAAIPADVVLVGYNIYGEEGGWSDFVGAAVTSYRVDWLAVGTSYTFRVEAVYDPVGAGDTVVSGAVTVKATTWKFPATKKPSLVKGSLTSSSATVSWGETILPTGVSGSVNYRVYITETRGLKPTQSGWSRVSTNVMDPLHVVFDGTKATIVGLSPNTTYYVYIRSVWSEDTAIRSYSAVITIKTPA